MSLFSRFRNSPTPSDGQKQPEPVAVNAAPEPHGPEAGVLVTEEEQSLQAAIAAGDTQTIAKLVVHGTSTKVRQHAAEAIDDPEQVRQLIRETRGGKDNSVYKILTHKRDVLLAHEREAEHLHAEVEAAAAAIERHSHRHFDPMFTPTLEQLEIRWNAVAAHAAPDITEKTRQAVDRAREVIAQHLRQIAAEASRQLAAANAATQAQLQREQEERAAAAASAERAQTQQAERKADTDKREAEANALRQIGGLVRKAHGALASGSSKTAAGLRRAIDEKMSHAPSLPAHLANQLRQLDEKLQELKDWKSFSVAPKRLDLIERMESLIGATMHPTALAGHIKDLQEQWRTLSKGAGEDAEADWQRFHDAAQKAFQPCREFFAGQDKVKEENLHQRGLLFERLATFEAQHNWEEPDWRNVITAVREARQLWREHSPVDPAAVEELQGRFNALTASLHARIDAEYARNVKEKKSLIERAHALVDSPEIRKAIDEVKRLQERWKAIGPVSREDDRKLWEEFRKQCDALFQKRQQEFATQNAALDSNKSQAMSLIEAVERIAELTGAELIESAKQLPEMRTAFDSIEELPRANARQLQTRFERALDRCRKAVAQQHTRDAEEGWTALLDATNAVRAYRLSIVRNADDGASLKQAAEAQLADIAHAPKRGAEALKQALSQTGGSDLAANELALRTLCIRAEVLTDTPTPTVDQPLRREYQVKRLMQSMGQGIKSEEGLDGLTLEWLSTGPTDEGVYLELLARFKACRKKAL